MIFIGIDPGASGGIAWINHDGNFAEAHPIPATERDVFAGVSRIAINARGIKGVIEKVGPMPKQGVTSTFKFGKSYGSLRMALVAAGIPFDEVTPQKWQAEFGLISRGSNLTKTERKNRNKQKAQQLFPSMWITHAIADALLLAEYARRKG